MKNNQPLKITVLASGSGTNLQTLIDAQQAGELPIEIVGVITNRDDAYAIERAKMAGIHVAVLSHVTMPDNSVKRMALKTFEKHALQQIKDWQPDLIVLAGFMRVLSGDFINACPAPMINLHPSLLPKFKGLDTHARAIDEYQQAKEKQHANRHANQHGCSVHIVTAELDAGQVLTQAVLNIHPNDTADTLQQRVHQLEYKILPFTIGQIAKGMFATDTAQYLDVKQTETVAECLPKLPWKLMIDTQ